MQATRVVALRHGETDWNVDFRIQGHTDIALNARGHEQAQRAACALGNEAFDAIYSSDLQRAMQTARAVASTTGLSPQPDPALRERAFGRYEGLRFSEVEAQWPQDSARWRQRDLTFGPGGGETLVDFNARCVNAAAALAAAHAGGAIILVAHGGVLDCLYRAAARIDLQAPRTWALPNAAINRLLYTEGGFTLVGWADVGDQC